MIYIGIIVMIVISLLFLMPYWVYLLIAAGIFLTKGKITYLSILCIILGIAKLVNKNKEPHFTFKRTYYYDSDFFNEFKHNNRYRNTYENWQYNDEYDKACNILGVNKNDSMEEKKKSYLKLLKKYHPDINRTEEAVEKSKEINDAWDIIQKYER